jgi:hypothetical protein
MSVAEYKQMAELEEYKAPYYFDNADLERKYYEKCSVKYPIYGADLSESITDKDVEVSVQYIGIFLNLYLIKKITCILKLRYGILINWAQYCITSIRIMELKLMESIQLICILEC